jgi:hypothetical protein
VTSGFGTLLPRQNGLLMARFCFSQPGFTEIWSGSLGANQAWGKIRPWLCKNSASSKARRIGFSDRSKSAAVRNCHCPICDPKRDLSYQFSVPLTFHTAKTHNGHWTLAAFAVPRRCVPLNSCDLPIQRHPAGRLGPASLISISCGNRNKIINRLMLLYVHEGGWPGRLAHPTGLDRKE